MGYQICNVNKGAQTRTALQEDGWSTEWRPAVIS